MNGPKIQPFSLGYPYVGILEVFCLPLVCLMSHFYCITQITEMLREADINGDGKIDYEG